MISDYTPIQVSTDPDFENIEIYFAHDIHCGSNIADMKKWDRFKAEILAKENRFIIWAGDYCDTAIMGSKSDIYTATYSIEAQKQWFTQQLFDLKSRTLAIIPGNHDNRIMKTVGLYVTYDCALLAGIEDKYRQHFAFLDVGVGKYHCVHEKQIHYVGYITHRLKDCKNYHGSDFVDGIDFAAYGHDHDPKDHSRSKLRYDAKNKYVAQVDVEVIDSGSFLTYGGYGADNGYRPQSQKLYKLILDGKHKSIITHGFHI